MEESQLKTGGPNGLLRSIAEHRLEEDVEDHS